MKRSEGLVLAKVEPAAAGKLERRDEAGGERGAAVIGVARVGQVAFEPRPIQPRADQLLDPLDEGVFEALGQLQLESEEQED